MSNYGQQQKWTKSKNSVQKLVVPKARKPSVKTIVHKISFRSIRRKG